MSFPENRFTTLSRGHTPEGSIHHFKLMDGLGRKFYYDGKTDAVQQWVAHPVADKHGYGDGYWRKARPAIAARVRRAVDKIMKPEERSSMSLQTLIQQWEKMRDDAAAQRDKLIESDQHAHAAEEVLGERAACYGQCAHQLKQFVAAKLIAGVRAAHTPDPR